MKYQFVPAAKLACLLCMVLRVGLVNAQSALPARCDLEVGGSVPAFSCSQGVPVHDNVSVTGLPVAGEVCDEPENLNNRCVNFSFLGRLDSGDPDVDVVFSCRPVLAHEPSSERIYNDVAAIQYNRQTGATCFYQHLGSETLQDDMIPAANSADGQRFFSASTNYCAQCHTNNAFVRTPHYESTGVIPDINASGPYHVSAGNPNAFLTYSVERGNNSCTTCHAIGAYSADGGTTKSLGATNYSAAGTHQSLFDGGASPTASGYDDYMASFAGGRDRAVVALSQLEECLQPVIPTDCQVIPTSQTSNGAPTAPGNLQATISPDSTAVELSWQPSIDPDQDIVRYTVFRDGAEYANVSETMFSDFQIVAGTSYVYSVIAFDVLEQASSPSGDVPLSIPEVVDPEVVDPEVVDPEVIDPEVVDPEVVEPEVVEPEVVEPEVVDPEVIDPEVIDPEVVDPEVVEPEVVDPEVIDPEVVDPEVIEPEVADPEVVEPEVADPEVVDPEDESTEANTSSSAGGGGGAWGVFGFCGLLLMSMFRSDRRAG